MRSSRAALLRIIPIPVGLITCVTAWGRGYHGTSVAFAIASVSAVWAFASSRPYWDSGSRFRVNWVPIVCFFLAFVVAGSTVAPFAFWFGLPLSVRLSAFILLISIAIAYAVIRWKFRIEDDNSAAESAFTSDEKDQGPPETSTADAVGYILNLEEVRRGLGYKPGWLYYRCREEGLLDAYNELLSSGKISAEKRKDRSAKTATAEANAAGSSAAAKPNDRVEDPYEVLGLQHGATLEDIKCAYREQIKLYHPDKVASLGPELKKVAERMASSINQAYQILMKQSD